MFQKYFEKPNRRFYTCIKSNGVYGGYMNSFFENFSG